jgi:hypothetical protein
VIFETRKKIVSRHILHQHWYTSPIALAVRRNPQHRSQIFHLLHNCFVSISTGRPGQASSATFGSPWENFSTQLWTALCDKHFPPSTGNISLWISFALSPFAPKETCDRTLLFGSTPFKHSRHFDYCNPPLTMRMRVCYLDCHEAGLCFYVVVYIENKLRPLQLCYSICDILVTLLRPRFPRHT